MKNKIILILIAILYGCNVEAEYSNYTESNHGAELRLAQWNIGHFSFGSQPNSRIEETNYYNQYQQYKEMLNMIDADVLAVCEYSEIFGENEIGEQYSREILFNEYPYIYEGHQSGYACNALFSCIEIDNVKSNTFLSLNTNYYYITADLNIGDKNVKFVSTHLAFNKDDDQYAILQIEELIYLFGNEEYVIMMGDWNIKDVDVFNLFVNAGYQLANHGEFGDFVTFSPQKNARNHVLDNIMTKGLSILNVSVISKDLSDHYPLIVTLKIDEETDSVSEQKSSSSLNSNNSLNVSIDGKQYRDYYPQHGVFINSNRKSIFK